jgi:hypothetical protein
MSYTYTTLVTAVATALAVDASDADFLALFPTISNDAEQLLYRELDLVSTSVAANGTMTANNRYFTLPTTDGSGNAIHVIVVDAINVFDAASKRHPMKPVSRDVVDFFWPSDTAPAVTSIPTVFARVDDTRVLVGSAPGAAWTAEVVGTIRPDPISATNTTTFLSLYLSDLLFKAIMADANGVLLKNYGAAANDPQQAVSWEGAYQAALASAKTEELRKNYISANSPLPASAKA